VCPVEDCITMEQIDLGLPPESWEQRTAHTGAGVESSVGQD
jgi:dihydropyrimidine dehydrogenase (NAD+) subunit PreA